VFARRRWASHSALGLGTLEPLLPFVGVLPVGVMKGFPSRLFGEPDYIPANN
jgi:hypothetical protein